MTKAFDFPLPGFVDEQGMHSTTSDSEDEMDSTEDSQPETELDSDVDFGISVTKHHRCFAHTLQLVVKDGFKEISSSLNSVLAKVASVVNFARSLIATEILEGEKRLQCANVTRWNSQLRMIKSVLDISEKLNKLDTTKISSYERKLLRELCLILNPFEEATVMVQSNNSARLAVPLTIGLRHAMDNISVTYNNKMTQALKRSLQKRMSVYEDDDLFTTAAILDPRFNLKWCEPEKVGILTEKLRTEASRTIKLKCSTETESSDNDDYKTESQDESLFSYMSRPRKRHTSAPDSLSVEINSYLAEENVPNSVSPLDYWKDKETCFPTLAKMALYFLAIPSSSAPVERLFSVAGKTFRPERCRLKDDTFEKLMNIKCNTDINT
ncbi:zinc finger BED domain-containing protein 4-like [Ylistrum balloti]|uniref:zinc finger BED domain-containing protein 4-like n=1 Tax=Ylistrum balloti TaxID=509963 RepID=UPI002905DE9F|nr:zinc finger BED domain-containing protein 4-like [Ylistrum balloti]